MPGTQFGSRIADNPPPTGVLRVQAFRVLKCKETPFHKKQENAWVRECRGRKEGRRLARLSFLRSFVRK